MDVFHRRFASIVRYMRLVSLLFEPLSKNFIATFLLSLKACSKVHSNFMGTNTSAPIRVRIALFTMAG